MLITPATVYFLISPYYYPASPDRVAGGLLILAELTLFQRDPRPRSRECSPWGWRRFFGRLLGRWVSKAMETINLSWGRNPGQISMLVFV